MKLNKFKLNTKLLIQTLSLQSKHKDDEEARVYIFDKLSEIKNIKVEEDDFGNILVKKGNADLYPAVCSHYDTVYNRVPDKIIKQEKDLLFAFSYTNKTQIGIAGDDLVGVSLCLQLLQEIDNIKVVFFRSEEVGTLGSKAIELSFFDDCKYVIQIDRKGNSDFSIDMSGIKINSDDFINDASSFIKKYNYNKSFTSVTDVYTLKLRGLNISVTNVSCGYYNPHCSNETVSITDVNTCYCLVTDLINNLKNKRYIHNYVKPVYNYNTTNGGSTYYIPYIQSGSFTLNPKISNNEGYYTYKGVQSIIRITNNYSYLANIKALYNKEKNEYIFIDQLLTSKDAAFVRKGCFLMDRVILKDEKGIEFVYSMIFDSWLPKKEAVVYRIGDKESEFRTYITKKTDAFWNRGY